MRVPEIISDVVDVLVNYLREKFNLPKLLIVPQSTEVNGSLPETVAGAFVAAREGVNAVLGRVRDFKTHRPSEHELHTLLATIISADAELDEKMASLLKKIFKPSIDKLRSAEIQINENVAKVDEYKKVIKGEESENGKRVYRELIFKLIEINKELMRAQYTILLKISILLSISDQIKQIQGTQRSEIDKLKGQMELRRKRESEVAYVRNRVQLARTITEFAEGEMDKIIADEGEFLIELVSRTVTLHMGQIYDLSGAFDAQMISPEEDATALTRLKELADRVYSGFTSVSIAGIPALLTALDGKEVPEEDLVRIREEVVSKVVAVIGEPVSPYTPGVHSEIVDVESSITTLNVEEGVDDFTDIPLDNDGKYDLGKMKEAIQEFADSHSIADMIDTDLIFELLEELSLQCENLEGSIDFELVKNDFIQFLRKDIVRAAAIFYLEQIGGGIAIQVIGNSVLIFNQYTPFEGVTYDSLTERDWKHESTPKGNAVDITKLLRGVMLSSDEYRAISPKIDEHEILFLKSLSLKRGLCNIADASGQETRAKSEVLGVCIVVYKFSIKSRRN